ncbi:hypothetical protein Tco_0012916 [Tanacetum coccineum]
METESQSLVTTSKYSRDDVRNFYGDVEALENLLLNCIAKTSKETRLGRSFIEVSLSGFRSCTSRSRYQSVSKQTTRLIHIESRKSPTKSLFDVGSRRISIFTVNTKEYHSDVLAIITRIMRRT